MKKLAILVIFLALLVGVASIAMAQEPSLCRVPGDYSLIQDAVDDTNCEVIIVGEGFWSGATIDRPVEIRGEDGAIIDDGPNSHSFLRAGFLFEEGSGGSGTKISGFTFQGATQSERTDDENLDFPIFSRGVDNVTIDHNVMENSLQAITNWHGSGWHIHHNTIDGLWTLCGGGIGIILGSRFETPSDDNIVAFNRINAEDVAPGGGFYTTPGIALMSDARYGWPGGFVRNNKIIHNDISVTGFFEGGKTGVGIELSDIGFMDEEPAVVIDNKIMQNDPRGSSLELMWNPEELESYNKSHNNPGKGKGHGVPPFAF